MFSRHNGSKFYPIRQFFEVLESQSSSPWNTVRTTTCHSSVFYLERPLPSMFDPQGNKIIYRQCKLRAIYDGRHECSNFITTTFHNRIEPNFGRMVLNICFLEQEASQENILSIFLLCHAKVKNTRFLDMLIIGLV